MLNFNKNKLIFYFLLNNYKKMSLFGLPPQGLNFFSRDLYKAILNDCSQSRREN
jgi:hypothetical protein